MTGVKDESQIKPVIEKVREMESRFRKRMALRRKLHTLRTLTSSKSVMPEAYIFFHSSSSFVFIYMFQYVHADLFCCL